MLTLCILNCEFSELEFDGSLVFKTWRPSAATTKEFARPLASKTFFVVSVALALLGRWEVEGKRWVVRGKKNK